MIGFGNYVPRDGIVLILYRMYTYFCVLLTSICICISSTFVVEKVLLLESWEHALLDEKVTCLEPHCIRALLGPCGMGSICK